MLFNTYTFIFLFLPSVLVAYLLLVRQSRMMGQGWLVFASLFFYGWWNPSYLLLICASMVVNFAAGGLMMRRRDAGSGAGWILFAGVIFNLVLLCYYKYALFFIDNFNFITGAHIDIGNVVLPLAISFFTFQQIAYLADTYKGVSTHYSFLHYSLFVTFFPQLIAGPIVHHREMMPQFEDRRKRAPSAQDIVVGLSIFAIGLFKKSVIADGVAVYASPVFDSAASGEALDFFAAWSGALAYTFQLYFDFSGYSDMAIGSARLFGIRLPQNFFSPYRSTSISEFWRRWHMTLSRFLRDYIYIPLGGNRRGPARRYANLATTMLLGGLWHGAGWTFVAWGALHGLYLCINHAWQFFVARVGWGMHFRGGFWVFVSWLITFLAVVIGWVFFRATDFDSAIVVLRGMTGVEGFSVPQGILVRLGEAGEWITTLGVESTLGGGATFVKVWLWIAALFPVALFCPNTQQIMGRLEPVYERFVPNRADTLAADNLLVRNVIFSYSTRWALVLALISVAGVLSLSQVSEFLYFQF